MRGKKKRRPITAQFQIREVHFGKLGGRAAKGQDQIRTSSWNKPSLISPHKVLWSLLINTVYHL